MRRRLYILLISLPLAALAASSPEVVLPECAHRTVAESCGGVNCPEPKDLVLVTETGCEVLTEKAKEDK